MKINNTIQEVRETGAKLNKENFGRIAVIVLTPYEREKANYGIQFWIPELIQIGYSVNPDNSISTFIEKL